MCLDRNCFYSYQVQSQLIWEPSLAFEFSAAIKDPVIEVQVICEAQFGLFRDPAEFFLLTSSTLIILCGAAKRSDDHILQLLHWKYFSCWIHVERKGVLVPVSVLWKQILAVFHSRLSIGPVFKCKQQVSLCLCRAEVFPLTHQC